MGETACIAPSEYVTALLDAVPDERRRTDARDICALLVEVAGEPPALWNDGIVGFGSYHFRYDSGHDGDACLVGFAPRKPHLALYLASGLDERYPALMAKLRPHKTGKGCLYLKTLAGVDRAALRELIDRPIRVHRGIDRASR